MGLCYKRVLLKLSGEALAGPQDTGFDEATMQAICGGVKAAHALGAQIGIVVDVWKHYPARPGNPDDEALVLYNNECAGYGI